MAGVLIGCAGTLPPGPTDPETPPAGITTFSTTYLPFDMPNATHFDAAAPKMFPHYMAATNLRRTIGDVNLDSVSNAYEDSNFLPPGGVEGSTDHRVYGGFERLRFKGRAAKGTVGGRAYWQQDHVDWFNMVKDAGMRHVGIDILSASGTNSDEAFSAVHAANATGMKIVLMPDGSTLKNAGATAAANHVAALINSFPTAIAKHTDGRYLVCPYSPEDVAAAGTSNEATVITWWTTFMQTLEAAVGGCAMWPCFQRAWLDSTQNTLLTFKKSWAAGWLVGAGRWGTSDPAGVTSSATDAVTSRNTHGLPFLGSNLRVEDVRPNLAAYWEPRGWELYNAGAAVLTHASNKPDMQQIPTLNDQSESTSIAPTREHGDTSLDLLRYEVCKFRLGYTPPIVRDTLYLAHRQQMVAGTTYTAGSAFTSRMALFGSTAAADVVSVKVFATAAADVEIVTSAGTTTVAVSAGVSTVSAPLALGAAGSVQCRMKRTGAIVAGTEIVSPWAVQSSRLVDDYTYRRMSSRR